MSKQGQIVVTAAGVGVSVAGASVGALSAATVIVAIGAAVAVGFAGYGIYCWLSSEGRSPSEVGTIPHPPDTALDDKKEPPKLAKE